jgi:hypothetical protein
MWEIGWMFFVVPLVLIGALGRHWGYGHWRHGRPDGSPRMEEELDEQRAHVETLERRVAELEERLDFTERLLASRSQHPTPA